MDKFSTLDYFEKLNKYFMAANYLSACQLYLLDNPLLEEKLKNSTPAEAKYLRAKFKNAASPKVI